jgi:uncharacterized membrane protein YfcA
MEPSTLVFACLGAVLVGMAKNGVPGLGILVVPLMATAFPARASVGILLPMLIVGDVLALIHFRRHAEWHKLWGLFPWVIAGGVLGALTLARVQDAHLKPLLGVLVLGMLVLELLRSRFQWAGYASHPMFTVGTGIAAGFATTIGNVAGPIMSMYLLGKGAPKAQFVGTAAWFFFLVNCSKVPIYLGLDMMNRQSLLFDAAMIPLIVVGALAGVKVFRIIPQKLFDGMILVLTAVAAVRLLV